jgi:hypothetical protein
MKDQLAAEATYLHKTQQMNIHAFRGILTRDPSNRAAANLHLKPHGHFNIILHKIYSTVGIVKTARIFPFFKLSRPSGGHVQPPTEWVSAFCPRG